MMVSQASPTVGFRKILVALDYQSDFAEVLDQAISLAKSNNSQLQIYYCQTEDFSGISNIPIYAGVGTSSGVYTQEMIEIEEKLLTESVNDMHRWLDACVQKARSQGIETEAGYAFGEAGRQICRTAKDWGADLIIMGRRGTRGLSELLMGSVSNFVIHHAHCSVLVVQHLA
jgi:nucleotide-binding universal stress UspA family protein